MKRISFLLLFVLVSSVPVFAQTACNGTYSSALGGVTYTVSLSRSTDSAFASTSTLLMGWMSTSNNIRVTLRGFVDSNNSCFVSAQINGNSTYGSIILVGKLTETTSGGTTVGTFNFSGGHSTAGVLGAINLPLTKTSNTATNASEPTVTLATRSYAGVYTTTFAGSPATLTLAQANSTSQTMLYGQLNILNGTSLYVLGFVDGNNEAYLSSWFGSAIVVGKLKFNTGSTTSATLDFSNGYTSTGSVGQITFSDVSVSNASNAATANFSGTYTGFFTGSRGTITLTQSGTTLTGSGTHTTLDYSPNNSSFTDTITGTVSGNVATVTWNTTDACITSSGTLVLSGRDLIMLTQKTGSLSNCGNSGDTNGIMGVVTK